MNKKIDIKPIAIALIVVGFLFFIKLQFPLYKVTSDAMLNSLKEGQIVLVNTWADLKTRDVVVVEHNDEVFMSRIIASYGDELFSKDGKVEVNGQLEPDTNLLFEYHIYCTSEVNDSIVVNFDELYPKREYKAYITSYWADSLKMADGIKRIEKINHSKNTVPILSKDSTFVGNRDNFGPIKVPNNKSFYWLMGDNRHKAKDSRYLGFISEDEIIGKVVYTFNGF